MSAQVRHHAFVKQKAAKVEKAVVHEASIAKRSRHGNLASGGATWSATRVRSARPYEHGGRPQLGALSVGPPRRFEELPPPYGNTRTT